MKMLCSVQLSKHRYKTPEGYLVCKDCIIARTGKQTYLKSELYGVSDDGDQYVEVDRKPSQVFDEKTLASFEGKPLTIDHPDVSVSPENYKNLSVGNVHNVHRGDFNGQDVMYADITVYDAEAIGLIENGEMEELSCGYDCDITDGPNPEQINIRGNHVALCEQGRAGIARIQDALKVKEPKEAAQLRAIMNYHYRTDLANEEDMSDFPNRLIYNYMVNELSRQLTDEEKAYVRACLKTLTKDKWGIKPVVVDSVQKGTLIQEFGKYGEQYKITKIQGNVLYCEDVNTGKVFLFKKDKENVDWAIITKSDIKDSLPSEDELEIQAMLDLPDKKYGITLRHAIEDLRSHPKDSLLGNELAIRMLMSRFGLDKRSVIRCLNYMFDGKVTPKDAITQNRDILASKDKHYTVDVRKEMLVCYRLDDLHSRGGFPSLPNPYRNNVYDTLEEALVDAKKLLEEWKPKNESTDKYYVYYNIYVIEWQENGGVYVNEAGENIGISPTYTTYDPSQFKGLVKEAMKKQGHKVEDAEEKKYMVYYYSPWNGKYTLTVDGVGLEEAEKIFEERVKALSEFNKRMSNTTWYNVFIEEEADVYGDGERVRWAEVEKDGEVKMHDFSAHDSEPEEFVIALAPGQWLDDNDRPTNEKEKAKRFATEQDADAYRKIYCKGSVEKVSLGDSKEAWSDLVKILKNTSAKFDEETETLSLVFDTEKEAKKVAKEIAEEFEYEIEQNKDGKFELFVYEKIEPEKETVKDAELLTIPAGTEIEVDHTAPYGWKGELVPGPIKLKLEAPVSAYNVKALRYYLYETLTNLFEKKYGELPAGSRVLPSMSSDWKGSIIKATVGDSSKGVIRLRKGAPSNELKNYLKDRGLEFEETEKDDFVRFSFKEIDDELLKEIKTINDTNKAMGVYDDYSKRFYSKAIRELREKLQKLERNELLDANQKDYQEQKEALKKELKSQIKEYSEKLNAL